MVFDDDTKLSRDDTATELLLATNNYVSTFNGFSEGEKLGELGGEDALVQDYLLSLTNDGTDTLTIGKPAGRIQIVNDRSPETYEAVIPVRTPEDSQSFDFSGHSFEVVIDNDEIQTVSCESDGLHLTVSKGAHTFYLTESSDNVPVYTNNYSGSGTVTTADGYYHLYFTVDSETIKS